ncbi:hypothetical protein JCM10908_000035 [Rhodotorula pacifica]|uniref:uncharacterized protein n=1 Tax=Rhodotorula pacifica TaxID=1495444 RepID=UPI0031772449
MAALLEGVQAQLLQRLSHLTRDENPYLAVKDFLRDQLFPDVPASAIYQLYALAGLLGICGLNILVSLIWRARKGAFWLFSMQQSPRLIRPHVVVAWSSIALIMIIFLEVFIALTIQFLHRNFYGGFAYFFFTVWFFAFWGGQTAAWSLGVSYIVHRHATSAQSRAWPVYAANILGPAVPIVYLAVLLYLAIPGGNDYSRAIDIAREVEAQLMQRAEVWVPGQVFSVLSLAWAMPLLQREAAHFENFLGSFKSVYTFFATSASLLVCALVSIAGVYFAAIRSGLTVPRFASAVETPTTGSQVCLSPQQRRVKQTLMNLRLTIILFMSLGVLFVIDAALAASSPISFVRSPLRAQVLILLPLYTFAILGLPCSILLLHAAYTVTPSECVPSDRSGNSSNGNRAKSSNSSKVASNGSPRWSRPDSGDLANLSIQLDHLASLGRTFRETRCATKPKFQKSSAKTVASVDGLPRKQVPIEIGVQVDVDIVVDEDSDKEEKDGKWADTAV